MAKLDFSFGDLKISIEDIPHRMIPPILFLIVAIIAAIAVCKMA